MTSIIKVDNIQNSSGTQAMNIHSSGFIIPPAGGIIQTQYTQVTARSETTSAAAYAVGVDVTPMNISITPVSTSSKVKIEVSMMGEFNQTTTASSHMFWLKRIISGTTTNLRAPADVSGNILGIAPATITYQTNADSTPEHLSFFYFDEPNTTSLVKYQLTFTNGSAGNSIWRLNQNSNTSGGGDYERGISCISATEIAG